nr:RcnB family protein [Solimonas marina]
MKSLHVAFAAAALFAAGSALADPPAHAGPPAHAKAYGHHKGEKLSHDHWGERVDYREHHLSPPPSGHEWRRVDNDYVLISVNTGLISSVISIGN